MKWFWQDLGQNIVQNILIDSPCALVSNFQTQGLCGVGNFNYAGTTTFFDGGMILRCGNVANTAGEYNGSSMSTVCSGNGDAQLLAISQANGNPGSINDVSFVKFVFVILKIRNILLQWSAFDIATCGF